MLENVDFDSRLFMLLKLGEEIASKTNLDEILNILGDTARDIVEADRCSIFIYDKKKNELWTKVAHGVEEIRVSADSGVVGKAALSREVQIVIDAYNDFRFNKDIDKETGYLTKNIIAVPLLNSKRETIGVFQALNKKSGFFDNTDAEMLVLIGNYASVSLENALLYRELKESHTKIIHKLSSAAEFKDNETSVHTKRVGLFAEILGYELGLSRDRCSLLKLTSPMHDIGKIGIPDKILLKPGKLSDEEFEVMRTHAQIGYDILYDESDITLKTAAMIAREHHEKWDGGGYPLGIRGEAISIEGRITALVDVYDALTSKRPYKEAWSHEDAKALIQRSRGEHFDPNVVDVFLKNFQKIKSIKEKYSD
ncbi:MAG: HD-GYP domain-containing protein [Campylobacterales bacterium]